MKKVLLCLFGVATSIAAIGQVNQNAQSYTGLSLVQKLTRGDLYDTNGTPTVSLGPINRLGSGNSTQVVDVILMGASANALTVGFGGKTALYASPEINSVSQIYRATATPGSGFLNYGYSSDGGTTWTANLGPVYSPGSNARYPQSVIYNPSGNTDPVNARIAYYAPTLDGASFCLNWGGAAFGVAELTTAANPTVNTMSGGELLIPDGGCLNTVNNDFWISDIRVIGSPCDYADSLLLARGVWNGSDYSFTMNVISVPDESPNGVAATSIAFGPDGTTGYAAVIGHENFVDIADSILYPTIYKTTDAGNSWNRVASLNLHALDTILQSGLLINTGFELDLSVDANGNAHILMDVGPAGSTGYSIIPQPGFFGICDIATTDGGTTWFGTIVGMPQSFRGTFIDNTGGGSDIPEDNRPQIARTIDGSKMFFVWFDTDTLTFATPDNLFPDAHAVGLDIATGMYTPEINLTAGTAADGSVTFGNVAPLTLAGATAGCYEIPISFQLLSGGSTDPTEHYYIDGLEVCDAQFTESFISMPLQNFAVGVNEIPASASFAIGQNYPNPFAGSTMIDINVRTAGKAVVEIHNALGQMVSSSTHELSSGINTISIDASKLNTGVYSYTVFVGSEKVSRMMMVK